MERASKLQKLDSIDLVEAYQTAVREIASRIRPGNRSYTRSDIDAIDTVTQDLLNALMPTFGDKDWTRAYVFIEFVCTKLVTAMTHYEQTGKLPNKEFYTKVVYGLLPWLMYVDVIQNERTNNAPCAVSIAHATHLWTLGVRLVLATPFPADREVLRMELDAMREARSAYIRAITKDNSMMLMDLTTLFI